MFKAGLIGSYTIARSCLQKCGINVAPKVPAAKNGEKREGGTKSALVEGSAKKKSKSKRKESYAVYIYKVLKQVHPDAGISSRATGVMNSFVNDIFQRKRHRVFPPA